MSQAFTGDLFAGSDLSFLLLNDAKFRVKHIVLLTLFILQFSQVSFQLGVSLLSELCLEHQTTFGRFIEEVSPVSEPIIAELLGDALSVGSLRPLLNEVVEEAEDLKVQAFEAVVLVVIQLLSYRVVVALEEVLALLVRCLLVLHRVQLKLLVHLLLQLSQESVLDLTYGSLIELGHCLRFGILINGL